MPGETTPTVSPDTSSQHDVDEDLITAAIEEKAAAHAALPLVALTPTK
jgi:hypothetical protein